MVKYSLIGIAIAFLMETFTPTWLTASLSKIPDVGFTTDQAIIFILGSSGVCLPTIFALFSFLPRKVAFAYSADWVMFSILTYDILLYK